MGKPSIGDKKKDILENDLFLMMLIAVWVAFRAHPGQSMASTIGVIAMHQVEVRFPTTKKVKTFEMNGRQLNWWFEIVRQHNMTHKLKVITKVMN